MKKIVDFSLDYLCVLSGWYFPRVEYFRRLSVSVMSVYPHCCFIIIGVSLIQLMMLPRPLNR